MAWTVKHLVEALRGLEDQKAVVATYNPTLDEWVFVFESVEDFTLTIGEVVVELGTSGGVPTVVIRDKEKKWGMSVRRPGGEFFTPTMVLWSESRQPSQPLWGWEFLKESSMKPMTNSGVCGGD